MGTKPLRPEDPRRLGDYLLLARLGEGGMGTVFLGRDPEQRLVAVKAVRHDYADREEFRARFRSEVNRVRQVPSFCTAAVLDADPDGHIPYLVVEYVDGPSLQEVVTDRGGMPAGDLHSIAVGVAAALTAIHGAGVIHRDLKPTNVLLSLGLPKVIDFGLAQALEVTSRHTRTDQVVGTVSYLSPERLDPTMGPMGPAADIFAWGAVVAYAGTGRNPFTGDSPMVTAARILTAEPDLSGLPDSLAPLVERALSKKPAARPTANELVQELLAAPSPIGRAPAARHAAAVPKGGRFADRELLEQLIAEGPKPAPARGGSPRPSRSERQSVPARAERSTRRGSRAESRAGKRGGVARRVLLGSAALVVAAVAGIMVAAAQADDKPPAAAPTPAAAGTPTAETLDYTGPSFFDPLTGPGRFPESSGESGSCRYAENELWVKASGPQATYQCPGPTEQFGGDQAITVDLRLSGAGSCANIWFRYIEGGRGGYQLTACPDRLVMEVVTGALVNATGKVESAALQPGTKHELGIRAAGRHTVVTVDGVEAFQAGSGNFDFTSGRVLLGVTNDRTDGTAEVRFANLDVRGS